MSDFDRNMQKALSGGSGFDPQRARSAQAEVFETYERKMKWYERVDWSANCLYFAAGIYMLSSFVLQASTTKEFVGYGMAIMGAFVMAIQFNVLIAIKQSEFVTLKETKQLRLALAGGATPPDEAAARPLRGLSRREKVAWTCGFVAVMVIVGVLSTWSNRQDDLWRLKAQGRIEAHSVLTLHRFPHMIPSFYNIKGPLEGAVLESATLNGQPVSFSGSQAQYTIRLPYSVSWGTDRIELVWSFPLPAMQDYGQLRAPLRSLVPVHSYSLILYVEDESGYVGTENAWKFNKSAAELANETEARRTLKCFTQDIRASAPRDDFGSCGLPIVLRPL